MSFYSIRTSNNNKIVGHYNQVINAIHHCDIWENPKFIDRIDFVKIDFEPIVSNAILEKKAKLTDLINASCVGFGLRLLISDKLKNILYKESYNKCQFFKSPVIFRNEKVEDYRIIHPYLFNLEFIDFEKSNIFLTENVFNKIKSMDIKNSFDFEREIIRLKKDDNYRSLYIEKFNLVENIIADFFILRHVEGGIKYIVSEKLKKEIEDAGCTGIEFQPVELSLNEWMMPGGEREKKYGKA